MENQAQQSAFSVLILSAFGGVSWHPPAKCIDARAGIGKLKRAKRECLVRTDLRLGKFKDRRDVLFLH